jgi:hypothetical protein
MTALLNSLDAIFEEKLTKTLDEPAKVAIQKLFDRLMANIEECVKNGNTFDMDNKLVLYEISYEEEDFPTDPNLIKDKSKYEFINKHSKYIEYFFTKLLDSPPHYIKINTQINKLDTKLIKKIKYILNIVLIHV